MQESDEIRRMKKLKKDTRERNGWDNDFYDRPPKGRHSRHDKKLNPRSYDEEE